VSQIPDKDHPNRWLYEQLDRIEALLFVIAVRQPAQAQCRADHAILVDILEKARQRVTRQP
jgi:hypothetical protein